ncbi:hypothetical protein [Microbacterium sp. PAMC21962]|uniref:hypothetical protein n=1 Tax=Microbacterium sp. PAMC21962 TaxID=2861280 RepID=UPI001C62F8E2|nr:hypothetical protein [Microbacterium sp. PAMC21962]QYF98273.1 hypothetical protein KY498_03235 [Microbacterium sp. PAMC21962]
MNASEAAAAHMLATPGTDRPETREATGDYARLREYVLDRDDLTADEEADFADLVAKRRAGTLEGAPARVVRKRQSVAGERQHDDDSSGSSKPEKTASELAAERVERYF